MTFRKIFNIVFIMMLLMAYILDERLQGCLIIEIPYIIGFIVLFVMSLIAEKIITEMKKD